jgi:hypothetical protein
MQISIPVDFIRFQRALKGFGDFTPAQFFEGPSQPDMHFVVTAGIKFKQSRQNWRRF